MAIRVSISRLNNRLCTRLFLLVLLFFATVNAIAQSSSLTVRQTEILRAVLRVDGELTKEQYDEFWVEYRHLEPEEREQFRTGFLSEFPASLEYQRKLWLAAKLSIKQHKPTITPELHKVFKQIEIEDRNNPTRRSRAIKMKKQAQELLNAAAYNTTIIKDGRTYQINLRVAEHVLAGLDGSLARLERLFAESWEH